MKTSLVPILISLCCLSGLHVTVGYMEEQEKPVEKQEKQEKQEANVDAANPPVQVEGPAHKDPAGIIADYERAAGYEQAKNKNEQAEQREAVMNEDEEKIKLEDVEEIDQPKKHYRFVHGFAASISVIIVSEIGDKTFFIAAIMAMKHSRWLVFGGAISALGLMTALSVCLGFATMIIPRSITFYISTALLALFGFKMLYEGYNMDPNEGQEELEEVSEELRKREESLTQNNSSDPEQALPTKVPLRRRLKFFGPFVSPIFLQSFTLTFLAEWGDRSQLTTIILGARENPLGVIIGGTLGHALCTALAVLGGKMLAQRISLKTVTLIGGVVFLLFAVTAIFHAPSSD